MLKKIYAILGVLSLFILFFLFYYKYVPLVKEFQIALVPILVTIFLVTLISSEWGILFFIFSFPLINNLPYFFGIYEHIPHAPTALVLFLPFLLGWILNRFFFRQTITIKHKIFEPLLIISLLIVVSGIITNFRYSNYFPFKSDSIYELTVNIEGTKSGGAFMSTLFTSLNYLTGFGFFFMLINTVRSKEFIKKILIVLSLSTCISMIFGLYQHFIRLSFGNLPSRIKWSAIAALNATFKDGNSFGAYLSFFIPFVLGLIFFSKGLRKVLFLVLLVSALFLLPSTASISSILGTVISLTFFFIFLIKGILLDLGSGPKSSKKIITITAGVIFVSVILSLGVFLTKDTSTFNKLKKRITQLQSEGNFNKFTGNKINFFWPIAGSMMKDYPVSGVGVGAYIIEISNYAIIMNKTPRPSDSAENYFLQVGSELGILGLFLFLWVLWEILKQVKKCFRHHFMDEKWRYVVIGISSGIVAFFINFMLHTYVGSFEVKYTFWLLIGMIFTLNQFEQPRKRTKLEINKKAKLAYMSIFVFFTATLTYNSFHSLSLEKRSNLFNLKQNFGFYKEEHDGKRKFRWTKAKAGKSIIIKNSVMRLPILASHPDIELKPVNVEIKLIKGYFEEIIILDHLSIRDKSWNNYSFQIPQELLNKEAILIIKTDRTWQPHKELGTPDLRELGVAIGEVTFELPQKDR